MKRAKSLITRTNRSDIKWKFVCVFVLDFKSDQGFAFFELEHRNRQIEMITLVQKQAYQVALR